MADENTRIVCCPRCDAYQDHSVRTETRMTGVSQWGEAHNQTFNIGYSCLACGHLLTTAEICDHKRPCPQPAEKGRNTTPEMWVRLGRQNGAEQAAAQVQLRRGKARRRNIWIAVGVGLFLLMVCCCGTYLTVGPGRNGI